MTFMLASEYFTTHKKEKKGFIRRLKVDSTIPAGLKTSLIADLKNQPFIYLIENYSELVGFISVEFINEWNLYDGDVAQISYYIFPEYRRRGMMKKALVKLSEFLYQNEGITLMVFDVDSKNLSSRNCLKSVGAIQRDDYTFELVYDPERR